MAGPARQGGLQVEFSGGVTATASSSDSSTEVIGLLVAFVILLVAFGTPFGAVLPLITALVGLAVGLLAISSVSGLTPLNSTAPTLASMLGLAVGIDYSLFIASRHRQQLLNGMAPIDSVALAVGTAGGAVCFAGFNCSPRPCRDDRARDPVPERHGARRGGDGDHRDARRADLAACTSRLSRRSSRAGTPGAPDTRPMGVRWAAVVTRRPLLTLAGVIAVLLVIAIPATTLRLALPNDSSQPTNSSEYRAYQLLTKGFGPGFDGPLTIVGDASKVADPHRAISLATKALGRFPDVAAVSAPVFNSTGRIAVVTITPLSGPDSSRTTTLVSLIRARARAADRRYRLKGYVTGRTAVDIDTSSKISAGLPAFLSLIVGLAVMLLTLVFRSIAVPLKAVAGFLLTIASTIGITTFVFQDGHGAGFLGVQLPM